MSNKFIRILIVDDEPETLKSLETLLALEPDFKVIGTVSNGIDAVKLAEQLQPDIVLMDAIMPTMDGFEATKSIVEHEPNTAHCDADTMQKAMLSSVSFIVCKPIKLVGLFNTIRDFKTATYITFDDRTLFSSN